MNGPIFLCSAITGVCMGFRVSEKSKGEQTCNQNFLILSLLHSSPVSPSQHSRCISSHSALPFRVRALSLLLSAHLCYPSSFHPPSPQRSIRSFLSQPPTQSTTPLCSPSTLITCFQLQVNAQSGQPRFHRDQDCLDQRGVLPDVRQQLVKAVNTHSLHHQRGNVDGFAAGHVVTQRHVVRAAVITFHL